MQVKGVSHLWADLKKARSRYLAVDYDGTLAPFRIERMDAFLVKHGILSGTATVKRPPDLRECRWKSYTVEAPLGRK